ncbi:MAG: hypothetical protein ACD_38C00161G0006 [uncultured bacterium]|uniref:Uncharacterized protein n=1 Tax=Candidatus Daviesbacteria bacterium GW2011_GWC2_40_12 TaxID=1618431 RepID=A0A0G0T4R7_9BACT|nr:MAG: hypothetical protein ACD_38C00161G0006 [uncultured bacterium]KKQ81118.1 MAG: hypothetical protein UT04_C0082G0004 [Candidatus Daviesbacteria bacterium GW2011_GWF2_38_7]KKR17021.1 MAG: hypothetical protein UT45_C0003G0051 [Candidatus Daviesbacteria bacterium GW2011_GWA2_39_33]KKR42085.1 MAG: hypothetical protein UT77_C0004G0069 [Candidatus Daviesbacteria bacterium GW2011_GWC2_40_12]OGE20852.1 MAG: hypothetical protein A2778_06290 [Candidatus Daviesbacteria bacterium RIFCSPHIGHO2_01_FULL_
MEVGIQLSTEEAIEFKVAPKVDRRQQTYDLLKLVRKPLTEEKEVLRRSRGIVFLPVNERSYAQVVSENIGHFRSGELDYVLGYVVGKIQLINYKLPAAIEVGFNPEAMVWHGGNGSRAGQLEVIEEYSQSLQLELPDARAIMLPSTGYAQADIAFKKTTGRVLIEHYFARALDDLSNVHSASVGRCHRSERFHVSELNEWDPSMWVKTVPAVVFVRNK